jgi:[ribosomal protein S18]-alanine N-acetyltransferase
MVSNYNIGLAVPSEANRIALLSRDIIEYGLHWAWTPKRVQTSMRDPSTNVVVARELSEVVGFVLMNYADDYAHLLLLGVAAKRRRQGVATALMSWLEETLKVAGIYRVCAEVREENSAARAFYQALGFEEFALTQWYYQGIENAVHVAKELCPA